MNDNFKTIYKILHILESNLDSEVINPDFNFERRISAATSHLATQPLQCLDDL